MNIHLLTFLWLLSSNNGSWELAVETVWSTKPQEVLCGPFQKKSTNICYRKISQDKYSIITSIYWACCVLGTETRDEEQTVTLAVKDVRGEMPTKQIHCTDLHLMRAMTSDWEDAWGAERGGDMEDWHRKHEWALVEQEVCTWRARMGTWGTLWTRTRERDSLSQFLFCDCRVLCEMVNC